MHKYIHPIQQHYVNHSATKKQPTASTSFKAIFEQASELKVSKHAKLRMQERNIHITDQTWEKIGTKLNEAKNKGVTDALVVVNDAALIVSAKNNTVVTALHKTEANNRIFTNINGTILI
ncbi:MAG TPA: flagellar protein [Candidatus Pseudogracilibacillus intestinigallinarum]|uniref:Flagellar protein n=1 Tax=Candidatus Pseudogracilibacillus intestinigallinarum TaxID=2838742 RepID=A0A9D1TLU7_9BACI|nr:flagellar protein [Candidatus Pseudogracilibacillus intestinigallinarum]